MLGIEFNNWLSLRNVEDRINAMPIEWQNNVRFALENSFHNTRLSSLEIRNGLIASLVFGKPLIGIVRKNAFSTLRNKYPKAPPSERQVIEDLVAAPHLCILLFAAYGIGGHRYWITKRSANQKSQKLWSLEREKGVAKLLLKEFGGMPSIDRLRSSGLSELSAFVSYLGTSEWGLDDFIKEYSLARVGLKYRSGTESLVQSDAGKKILRNSYCKLVRAVGHYVNDYTLSMHYSTVKLSNGSIIKSNTLRAYIKDVFGSIKNLFLVLIDEGDLPETFRSHINTPTASDKKTMDSWSEVHYYETLKDYVEKRLQSGEDGWEIITHPYIGTSKLKGDFLMGNQVYVELLRYEAEELLAPSKPDAIKYSNLMNKHRSVYKEQGITVFECNPSWLKHKDKLKSHFDCIAKAVLGSGINVDTPPPTISLGHPPGYWFDSSNIDKAIMEIIKNKCSDGFNGAAKFPSQRSLGEKYNGMVNHLKLKQVDWQKLAVKHNTFAINVFIKKTTKRREPTKAEILMVLNFHAKRLGLNRAFTYRELCGLISRNFVESILLGPSCHFQNAKELAVAMGLIYIHPRNCKFLPLKAVR